MDSEINQSYGRTWRTVEKCDCENHLCPSLTCVCNTDLIIIVYSPCWEFYYLIYMVLTVDPAIMVIWVWFGRMTGENDQNGEKITRKLISAAQSSTAGGEQQSFSREIQSRIIGGGRVGIAVVIPSTVQKQSLRSCNLKLERRLFSLKIKPKTKQKRDHHFS